MLEPEPEMVNSDLPEDILINIFSRMPTKFIGKCRCSSKTLRTLLSTPHFIKSHLAREKTHQHDNLILNTGTAFIHSITTIEDVTISRRIELPGLWEDVVGSCDGLVLLVNLNDEIFLVNPITLSTARIPNPPLDLENNGSSTLGFGYDSLSDDYKIGYVPCNYTDDVSKRGYTGTFMGVYSVKLGVWKRVASPPYRYKAYSYGVFINGAIHWLAVKSKVGELENWCVSALDLAHEAFFEIPVPIRAGQEEFLNIAGLGGCLCVLDLLHEVGTDIWIMEKYDVAGAWIKLYHLYSGDLLSPLCFIGGEEVVGIDDEMRLIVLDLRDQTSRYVVVDGGENEFKSGCTYFESLVEPTFGAG